MSNFLVRVVFGWGLLLVFSSQVQALQYYDTSPLTTMERLKKEKYHSEQDPFYKTGLVWMPTALTVGPTEHRLGFDVAAQYYIGSLVKETRFGKDNLSAMNMFSFYGDLKYSFWPEGRGYPAMALGYTLGLGVGKLDNPILETIGKADVDGEVLSNAYVVFSKRWDRRKTFATHIGYNQGDLNRVIASLNEDVFIDEGGAVFFGITKQFRKGRQLKFEWVIPVGEKETPIIMNTYLSSLFGFNLSFWKTETGNTVMAYYSFRLPFWPRISREEMQHRKSARQGEQE